MPVTYRDAMNEVKQRLMMRTAVVNRMLLEEIYKEAYRWTPMKEGALRTNVTRVVTPETYSGTIIWRQPYASYQERGHRWDGTHWVRNYTTPGTNCHYASFSVNKVMAYAPRYFQKTL